MKNRRKQRLSFMKKLKHQPIYRERFLHTMWICCAFIMLGFVESMFGPTFPDLRLIINESLETSSWLFTSTSAGFLVGSAATGFLYDRYNKLLILIFSILGVAVAQAVIPWCKYFWLMLTVKFLSGLVAAGLDTAGNAEVVSIWGSESSSYMQALHFCFSIGGVIAPIIAEPFLARLSLVPIHTAENQTILVLSQAAWNSTFLRNDSLLGNGDMSIDPILPSEAKSSLGLIQNVRNASNLQNEALDTFDALLPADSIQTEQNINQSFVIHPNENKGDNSSSPVFELVYGETKVQYAFIISAVLVLLTMIPFMCIYYIRRGEGYRSSENSVQQTEPTNFHTRPFAVKLWLYLLLSSLMFVYCGTEDTYAGFLMTFVTSELNWSKSDGSLATSVYWICFGGTRLLCIPLTRYVSIRRLMFIFSSLLCIAYAGLLLATIYNKSVLIWLCIGAPGIAMSILFAAIFSWTNNNVINVTGKVSSIFMTSASAGIMTLPILFGYTMDHFTPKWFMYLLLGQSILWVVLFSLTVFSVHCLLRPGERTALEMNVIKDETVDDSATVTDELVKVKGEHNGTGTRSM